MEDLFHVLIDLSEPDRAAEAARRAGADSAIARRALSLARAFDQCSAANQRRSPAPPIPDSEGRRFGTYQIERMIGRGGMGAVYLAYRVDGNVEHKVAVKIIGLPFEIQPFQERFRRERQILATLNHPNITHFIDGGVTPDSELYLIMEYVDGTPIDRYSALHDLPEALRLDLFRQVVGAVAYAHQNLIVHRDLKPANILVSKDGTPKLLDFGTAKLVDDDRFDNSTSTALLTVNYASPEQVRGEPATTLSDVYSLGVILYELMSGHRAFTGSLVARLDPDAERKQLTALHGDLDLIVRKATDPVPANRYSSVEQFGEDLLRFQAGKPVIAHPESAAYRIRKFVRRNRLSVGVALLAAVAILGGGFATLWQARIATQARQRAEARFQEVRQLGNYLIYDIHGGLQELPGSTALQEQVVERAVGFLDALSRDSTLDRQLQLEVAAGYQKLGDALGNPNQASLGDRKRALEMYDKA
ncbi:MAG: serine/threonine-protein kinase, partial [Bryobacteraceae bacterium]